MYTRFKDFYTEIRESTVNSLTTAQAKRACNNAIEQLLNGERFPSLLRRFWFKTTSPYTTGTAAVTNGSKAVVGTGTTWVASMVGCRFYVASGKYYIVAGFTDSTHITLEEYYTGTTDATATYTIDRDTYIMPWWVQEGGIDEQWQYETPVKINPINRRFKTASDPDRSSTGDPKWWNEVERNRDSWTYSTGTVSATSGSDTITGSGTAWDDPDNKVAPGALITIGANTYTVRSIRSDTELRIEDTASADASGSAYSISCDYPFLRVQLYPVPDDDINVQGRAYQIFQDLIDDSDRIPVPFDYHTALRKLALAEASGFDTESEQTLGRRQSEAMQETRKVAQRGSHADSATYRRPFFNSGGIPGTSGYDGPVGS